MILDWREATEASRAQHVTRARQASAAAGTNHIEEAHECKAKYLDLVKAFRINGWRAHCEPIKVGCQGFPGQSLHLTLLGIRGLGSGSQLFHAIIVNYPLCGPVELGHPADTPPASTQLNLNLSLTSASTTSSDFLSLGANGVWMACHSTGKLYQ